MRGIMFAACVALVAHPISAPAQPVSQDAIPYPSAAVALKTLQAKAGVKFSNNDGWTIANDTDGAIWSFTPSNHYAHPAVGRREIKQNQGQFFVETRILCQSSKANCDKLQADYQLLDRRMNEAIRKDIENSKKKK